MNLGLAKTFRKIFYCMILFSLSNKSSANVLSVLSGSKFYPSSVVGTYSNEHTFNLRKNPHILSLKSTQFFTACMHFVHSKKGHSWGCFVHPFFSMRLMRGEEGCFRPTTRQEERERKDARASISFCGLNAVLCVSSSLLASYQYRSG